MKKPVFLNPEMDIIKVETEDVIRTSLIDGGALPEGGGDQTDVDDLFP